MKQLALLFMVLVLYTGCKGLSEQSTQETGREATVTGEFLHWNDAAVLKTDTEIYGVVKDEKMYELDKRCKPLQSDEYHMIPVTVKGLIRKNPQSGSWEEVIQIQEIISVSASENVNKNK